MLGLSNMPHASAVPLAVACVPNTFAVPVLTVTIEHCTTVSIVWSIRQQLIVGNACRASLRTRGLPARCLQLWRTTCSMLALLTSKLRLLPGWPSWTCHCCRLPCLSLVSPSRYLSSQPMCTSLQTNCNTMQVDCRSYLLWGSNALSHIW